MCASVCKLRVHHDRGSSDRGSGKKMVGKTLLKSTTLHLLQRGCVREEESREKREKRERDGGHSVDKAVLFLIYVLL